MTSSRGAAGQWGVLLSRLLSLGLALLVWAAPATAAPEQQAVLAGGCFWCLEHDLETLPGVLDVESGYSGGQLANPSYRQVSAGGTGHQEVVRVRFDPERIRYATLLRAYWRNIDPLDGGGQFCDRGSSYRPVIFTASAEQAKDAAASVKQAARELGVAPARLAVVVKPLQRFWPAEAYHQDYAKRNTPQYTYYRWACGRDRRLNALWGSRARQAVPWSSKPDRSKLRKS
ncbi:MAG: peptide-methionine (S)-S-oxide reductase MsrA [Cyanobacteriota bacterium]|nr:peptide-methionine (S)-S-oxide reductase MsrA [Cyanobacteriota bacterium]